MESSGIWFRISEELQFRVRRFGGKNSDKVRQAIAKYNKPYTLQIQKGTLDPDLETELMTKAFVESCLTDWKGVEIDGEPQEFSTEKAIELLIELPELTNELIAHAQKIDNYKVELGNS